MMLAITSGAFSQTWPSKPVLTVEDYIKKRKSQRTGALLLLIGGTGYLPYH